MSPSKSAMFIALGQQNRHVWDVCVYVNDNFAPILDGGWTGISLASGKHFPATDLDLRPAATASRILGCVFGERDVYCNLRVIERYKRPEFISFRLRS